MLTVGGMDGRKSRLADRSTERKNVSGMGQNVFCPLSFNG